VLVVTRRTPRRVTVTGPVTVIWQARRARGSFAFMPFASVARSSDPIGEQCSAPVSTRSQQVPHSQFPSQIIGHQ
jgi:hypothetical protein